jgi:hypothetical protein
MLNDPTMIEASKALADGLLQKNSDANSILQQAFERIICRKPSAKEMEQLVNYWNGSKASLEKNPSDADKIIYPGMYRSKTKNKVLLAATMETIQIIYNMQEAITKT